MFRSNDSDRARREAKIKEFDMLKHGLVPNLSQRDDVEGLWSDLEEMGIEDKRRKVFEQELDVNDLPSLDDYDDS